MKCNAKLFTPLTMVHQDKSNSAAVHAAQLACLVHLAKADSVVKQVESHTIAAIMAASGADADPQALQMAEMPHHDISALRDLAPGVKQKFLKMLWLLALCDGDLHAEEEQLIYQVGDMLEVDRRTLAETQRFVALCLDRDGMLAGNC